MDALSIAIGFVVGAFTGAAAHYYGEKYTDKRRSQESEKANNDLWKDLLKRFPVVIQQMKDDVNDPRYSSVREFFVKPSRVSINRSEPYFEYHTDKHSEIGAAMSHLEDLGFIEDITPGNCPMYRMREHFVDLLRSA